MLALGATWWLRLRAVQHRFSLVIAERARVSREIHDTLLQSLGAIGLELETIASQLDPSQRAARDSLRRLRQDVRRSRARGARVDHGAALDRLEDAATWPKRFAIWRRARSRPRASSGRRRRGQRPAAPLLGGDRRELLRIGQEAVSNAVRHGRADAESRWRSTTARTRCRCACRDDGAGFVPTGIPRSRPARTWVS